MRGDCDSKFSVLVFSAIEIRRGKVPLRVQFVHKLEGKGSSLSEV